MVKIYTWILALFCFKATITQDAFDDDITNDHSDRELIADAIVGYAQNKSDDDVRPSDERTDVGNRILSVLSNGTTNRRNVRTKEGNLVLPDEIPLINYLSGQATRKRVAGKVPKKHRNRTKKNKKSGNRNRVKNKKTGENDSDDCPNGSGGGDIDSDSKENNSTSYSCSNSKSNESSKSCEEGSCETTSLDPDISNETSTTSPTTESPNSEDSTDPDDCGLIYGCPVRNSWKQPPERVWQGVKSGLADWAVKPVRAKYGRARQIGGKYSDNIFGTSFI